MFKLLLADDEPIILDGIRNMVNWESLGISITASCENGITALDSMLDCMPDILLTDVCMPGMDGLELAQHALALHPQLKIIILSGYDTFDYAKQAIHLGVEEYLLKPCDKEEIEATLVRVCTEVEREREKVLFLSGERQVRVKRIAQEMVRINTAEISAEKLEQKLRELAKTAQDTSLVKDALGLILTRSADGGQAKWKRDAILSAFSENCSIESLCTDCLLRLRAENCQTRHFVQTMCDYVDEHFGEENLSLQYLADNVVYMSADYIGREFSRAMGKRFSLYLLSIRMEHAKSLLSQHKDMHRYEIAEAIGLGHNPHYFSQVFRKYTGMTPREYRSSLDMDLFANVTDKSDE